MWRAAKAELDRRAGVAWKESPRYERIGRIDKALPSKGFMKLVEGLPRKKGESPVSATLWTRTAPCTSSQDRARGVADLRGVQGGGGNGAPCSEDVPGTRGSTTSHGRRRRTTHAHPCIYHELCSFAQWACHFNIPTLTGLYLQYP